MILVGVVVLMIVVARLWSRAAALEQAVADLRVRLGAFESGQAAAVRPLVTHPPVLERPEPRLKPSTPEVLRRPDRPQAAPASSAGVTSSRARATERDSLETIIGSRWLLYVGVLAIVVGVAYFEKLAIDNHWINETARVIQGGVVGLALIAGGLRLVNRRLTVYGQMICGCGVAVLYVSTYAAFNFYHLIGRPLALVVMCAVTALAAGLADRQRSQGLAILAVGGGFLTPFLMPAVTDTQIALFGYETVLIAGTMALAHRRTWPALNIVSYVFTVVTVSSWAADFYLPSKYLPTEWFLTLFCGMYLYVLYESRRSQRYDSRAARAVLWTGPVLYYLGSLSILGAHPIAMLVFLILLSLVGATIGLRERPDARRSADWRLVFWLAAFAPLVVWTDKYRFASWLIGGLVTIAAVYVIHLVAHLDATTGEDRPLTRSDIALLHLNGLAAFGAAYWLITPVSDRWSAPLAIVFAAWHGAIAWMMSRTRREQALHFAALGASLLVCAIGLQFDGAWVTMGWAAEGAAIIALGLRAEREWLRAAGVALFGVAVVRLFGLELQPPTAGEVVFLNQRAACGFVIVGLTYWLAWLHQRQARPERRDAEVTVAIVLAKLVVLSLFTAEIDAYWSVRGAAGIYSMAREALAALTGASVGAVLVWLGLTRGRLWVRVIGGVVLVSAIVRLVTLELTTPTPGYLVFANPRLMASAVIIGWLYGLATLYRNTTAVEATLHARTALVLAANALTLLFLTSEITAFWHVRDAWNGLRRLTTDAQFAREMMLSMTWAGYATALVVAGIRRNYAPIRYLAFAVFGVTILKVFMVDLAELDRIYRVTSIIALGVTLLVTSYLYHRFRGRMEATS
jgi:hypothetical protein